MEKSGCSVKPSKKRVETEHPQLRFLGRDFAPKISEIELTDSKMKDSAETFDQEIRAVLWDAACDCCPDIVDNQKALEHVIRVDCALFDSYMVRHREYARNLLEEEVRNSVGGINADEFALAKSNPTYQSFFKKIMAANELITSIFNIFNMAEFYANVKLGKKATKLKGSTLSSTVYDPKTTCKLLAENLLLRLAKTAVKITDTVSTFNFNPTEIAKLASKIGLLLVIRSNPILSLYVPGALTTAAFPVVSIPVVSKVLKYVGLYKYAEKTITKTQLLLFCKEHTPHIAKMIDRLDYTRDRLALAFDRWSRAEGDQKIELQEQLKAIIDDFDDKKLTTERPVEVEITELNPNQTKKESVFTDDGDEFLCIGSNPDHDDDWHVLSLKKKA